MTQTSTPAPFGDRYAQALSDAALWHREQKRKGGSIPYVSHLLAVSSLVMEDGGNEDECIAGLLHDSIEDTPATAEQLVERYGERVAQIVVACTDDAGGDPHHKAPWWTRKVHHIAHVASMDDLGVARVTAADKLANLRSTLDTVASGNHSVFDRFKAGLGGFAWYHETFGRLLADRLGADSLLGTRLNRALDELTAFVESYERSAAALQQRLAGLPVPPGSGSYNPWPWFAVDLAYRGESRRDSTIERWASWFDVPLPSDAQNRSALMDVLSARSDVQQILRALG